MKYNDVIKECSKLLPYVIWGEVNIDQRKIGCLTFGINEPINFLGENIYKFDSTINNIWNNKDKSVYYLLRKDIENYVIKIIKTLKKNGESATQNNIDLKKQWEELINKKIYNYYVTFPIYGVVINEPVQLGLFSAYNSSDYGKFVVENFNIPREQVVQLSLLKKELNYLVINSVEAKNSQRAIELARPYFELFESVAKFCLYGDDRFDVGIFNYNAHHSEEGYAFKKPISSETYGRFASSSKSKGAFQPLPLKELSSSETMFLWEIVSRYIKGQTTELENRLVNAIRWIGIANSNQSEATQYVQYVFALESLLAYNPQNDPITPSISAQLAEYAAFIVGENANEKVISKGELRKKIFKDVKKIYANRSKVVHGSDIRINNATISGVRETIYIIVHSVAYNKEILKMTSMNELARWIEDLKFLIH